MSFKPVVQTGSDPKFYDNAQRFSTYDEAMLSAKDLMSRWMLVIDIDVQESTDPVNYQIIDSVITSI
jgi:hypothetical protein